MKPLIGIVSLYDETKESYWMLPDYAKGLEAAGGAPVFLPLTQDREELGRFAQVCDGFLFPGGHDLAPELYGESPRDTCGVISPERDGTEQILFPFALKTRKPMLGICRGLQLFNVLLGGTLYQDLPTEFPHGVNHHGTPPYHQPLHPVKVLPNSPLYPIVQAGEIPVNSYHHQGVRTLGHGLKAAATAPDGLVEALFLPGRPFFLAVQWHPEFSRLTEESSRRIFAAFVEACSREASE